MAKYLQSSENIPINETGDNISFDLSNQLKQKINEIDILETKVTKLTPVLLWTNPNPSYSMGDTNLDIDLSNYRYIEIEFFTDTSMGTTVFVKGKVGSNMDLISFNGSSQKYYIRSAVITLSQVQVKRAADPGVQFDDSKNVPYKIYGIH